MATDVQAPSTSSGSPSKDIDAEVKELIGQGRRHQVMGEIPNAVNCFQECCALLAAKYGETADEVGEAYYLYGKSLIELARMETGVLGNALQGVPDESESEGEEGEDDTVGNPDEVKGEEREQVSKDVGEAFEAVIEAEEAAKEKKGEKDSAEKEADTDKKEAKDDGKEGDDSEAKDDKKEEKDKEESDAGKEDTEDTGKSEEEVSQDEEMETGEEDQSEDVEGKDSEKDSEKESEKESEASEDVGNLQLAWEVLELARNIYSKKEAKEDRLKLAQIYLNLGEVGLETEKYEQAAEDFMSCLKIQQELLEAEDRLLAESHYQLGLAYSLGKDYDKSIEYYRNSHNVIKSRIGMLEGKIGELETAKGKEPVSSDDPIMVHRKEVEELKALVPEINSKIEDAEEMKKGAEEEARAIMAAELGIGAGVSSTSSTAPASTIAVKKPGDGASSSEAKPATDISHLVRKRRKSSDKEKTESGSDAKKARQEENGGGDKAAVNGTAINGTAMNGTATNGAGTSSTETSPDKDKQQTKITPKTVEDLKKDQQEKEKETAATETASS